MSVDYGRVVIEVLEKNVAGLKVETNMMDHTLGELGVDSLDVMLVMMDIQEKTGVVISDEKVDELNTPSKIVAFLESN
ncbi:acyl carrier protein [Metapseudomonas furukawaii]|nr:acyl carrier protein [Pseudomonas furukawaii]